MKRTQTSILNEITRLIETDNLTGLGKVFARQKGGTSEVAADAMRAYIQCSSQILDPALKPSSEMLDLVFAEMSKENAPQGDLDQLMAESIYGQQWKTIPYLYALGARTKDINTRRLIITHLGRGQWTYPELLVPDLLDKPDDIGTLGRQMFQRNEPPNNPLDNDHLERFIGFVDEHAKDKQTVCVELSKSLSGVLFDITSWRDFESIPNAMNGVKLLMGAGLIDETIVKESEFLKWNISDKFHARLAQIREEILDENTAQSGARPNKAVRL